MLTGVMGSTAAQASTRALAFAIALGAAAALAHGAASLRRPPSVEAQLDLPTLPSRVLGPLTFGFKAVAADLFLIDAVQANGARRASEPEEVQERIDRTMVRALRAAVDLDPRFAVAYRFAGYAGPRQTADGHAYNVRAMVPLLEQGARECIDDWRIPFLLGFYRLYYFGEIREAAASIALSASRPQAPAYLGFLATRLAADANDLQAAERLALSMMEQSDEATRAQWEARLLDLHMERDLRTLEAAAQRYHSRTGRWPSSPRELVSAGDLPAVPAEPHGGRYSMDPLGQAHSSASKRLRVQGRPGIVSGLEVH